MKKKFLVFLLAMIAVFTLTSCKKKYTVSFDSNGGSAVESVEVKKNATVTKPANPTKSGYDFKYWESNGVEYNFSTKVKGNLNLKAVWEKAECKHVYDNDCDETCNLCGATRTPNHKWVEATYEQAKHCSVCGKTEGQKLVCTKHIDKNEDHVCDNCQAALPTDCSHANWADATCEDPKVCTNCGKVEGEALGHDWAPATALAPKTCKRCNKTEGKPLECVDHVDNNNDKKCDICGATMGKVEYKPKWTPNQQTGGWNGNGMIVKILVLPKSSFDPFDAGYTQNNSKILQRQIRNIESEYGIDLVYEDWPDAAPWGPDRVEYIKTKTQSGDFASENVYVVNISTSWIPTLVKNGCLAELATLDSGNKAESGIFTEIGYQETYEGSKEYVEGTYLQNETNNQVTSSLKKVYGYVQGNVHPDYFLYYNADLIAEAGMEDPAELWFKGEWTWSKFEEYCKELQTNLSDGQYALSIGFPEFVIGSTASTGSKIATTRPSIGLTSVDVINRFSSIQSLFASGCYANRGVEDVSQGFLEKNVAIVHGDLWFIGDASRFDPAVCDFVIGSVPYPTADNQGGEPILTVDKKEAIKGYDGEPITNASGDYISGVDMSNSSFQVPYGSTSCNSIIDTQNGKNGINNKIIFAILYDLYDGLGDNPEQAQVSEEVAYRNWLLTKFDRELYADVIMSVQGCTYFELIELVSMTVGGGSHFGTDAFWPLAASICKDQKISPATKLNEVLDKYKEAMRSMGYIVQ